MLTKLLNKCLRKMTKNYTEIPLFYIAFDFQKYRESGEEGSCLIHHLPDFDNDEELKQLMFDVIDYIRENYDMEQFTKV